MFEATLEREAAASCYNDVRPTINATVRDFVRAHGGDEEDLRADANTAFLRGWRKAAGRDIPDFHLYIRRWVWYALFDEYRTKTQYRRKNKTKAIHIDDMDMLQERPAPGFALEDFIAELGEDAAAVVRLVVGDTAGVHDEALARGGAVRNLRGCVRRHFLALGWTRERVNASFAEISSAL